MFRTVHRTPADPGGGTEIISAWPLPILERSRDNLFGSRPKQVDGLLSNDREVAGLSPRPRRHDLRDS